MSYANRYMRSRATVLAHLRREEACKTKKGDFCGFGLGFVKTVDGVYTGELVGHVLHAERKAAALALQARMDDEEGKESWERSELRGVGDGPAEDARGGRRERGARAPRAVS